MRSAETPQVFTAYALKTAYNLLGNKEYTDDVEVVRAANFKVNTIENLQPNIKLTVPEDLLYLKFLLQSSEPHQESTSMCPGHKLELSEQPATPLLQKI
jgi:2-C-methyl-D-erythritol 4-phosphate cytidylyltransferase